MSIIISISTFLLTLRDVDGIRDHSDVLVGGGLEFDTREFNIWNQSDLFHDELLDLDVNNLLLGRLVGVLHGARRTETGTRS